MNTKKVLLFAFLFVGITANAKGKAEKFGNIVSATEASNVISLDDVAAKWSDGSYSSRNQNSGMWEPMASGKDEIKFIKGENGKVKTIQIGSTNFEANASESSPFVNYYYNGSDRLHITENTIVKYYKNSTTKNCEPKKFWGKKPSGVGALGKEIAEFLESARAIIEKEKAAYSENQQAIAEKKAAERKEKYGLEDKEVASIKVINLVTPEKFGHFTNFTFNVEATLKDGSTISTEGYDQGYLSDYTITYDNTTWDDRGLIGGKFIPGDKIVLNVALAKDPSIKTSVDVVMKYNQAISFSYNGTSWSRGAGEPAGDYKIEVKQDKHAVTGEPVLRIRISNLTSGAFVSEFSMSPDFTMTFNCKGGNGGSDNGTGNNGADGGNILVVKDPSVKVFDLNYDNRGGRGGSGASASYNGRDGRDGTFKEEVRAVKF